MACWDKANWIDARGFTYRSLTSTALHSHCDGYDAWADDDALLVFQQLNSRDPASGDSVTLCNSASGFYDSRTWNGSAWIPAGGGVSTAAPFPFPRSAVTLCRKGYRSWSDFGALTAISEAGHAFVVDGDCVTLYDDTWTETRYYKDGKWIEDSLYFPGILSAPVAPTPSQPGIGDEVKPDLLSKKLRSW